LAIPVMVFITELLGFGFLAIPVTVRI
jgi:hypothetical protein